MNDQAYVRPLSEYAKILSRRKFEIIVPLFIVIPIAVFVAFKLPATYQSQATIMIEEPAVSEDYVRSATSSYAAQRVQVISKRVLALENVTRIIDEFGLYRQAGASASRVDSRSAEAFRQNVELDLVSAEVVDERTGRPTEATIAFTLAFSDADPGVAQQVAAELTEVFLEEDLRERTEQAGATAEFLSAEATRVRNDLMQAEQKMAEFKATNEGNLPEFYQRNLVNLEGARRELAEMQFRIQELEARRFDLKAKMAQISPSAPVYTSTGDVVMSDVDRLKALQSEYRRKVALYKDNHPDLIRLEREIATLQAELGAQAGVDELLKELQEQKQYLAEIKSRYSDSHRAVVSTRRVISQLEDRIAQESATREEADEPVADNPAYVMLQGELFSTESELRTLVAREQDLSRTVDEYEAMIASAPQVEREYKALLRELENTNDEYKAIKAKQRDAVVAVNLEQNRQGGSFVLLEPPIVPQDPVSPNRPSIILIGVLLALGMGAGLVFLREVTDSAIHGLSELTQLMGEAPLAAIPYIENRTDIIARRRLSFLMVALASALTLAAYDLTFGLVR